MVALTIHGKRKTPCIFPLKFRHWFWPQASPFFRTACTRKASTTKAACRANTTSAICSNAKSATTWMRRTPTATKTGFNASTEIKTAGQTVTAGNPKQMPKTEQLHKKNYPEIRATIRAAGIPEATDFSRAAVTPINQPRIPRAI